MRFNSGLKGLKVSVHLQRRKVGSLVKFRKRKWSRGTRPTNWN